MAANFQLPADRVAVLRMMPMPADANIHGDVFGGWIMAHVDIAGAVPAARRAGGRVATIAVTSFVFRHPVFVGDLVSFYADIVKTGTTSITVEVEVYVGTQPPAERSGEGDRSDPRLRRHRRPAQAASVAAGVTRGGQRGRLSAATATPVAARPSAPRPASARRRPDVRDDLQAERQPGLTVRERTRHRAR